MCISKMDHDVATTQISLSNKKISSKIKKTSMVITTIVLHIFMNCDFVSIIGLKTNLSIQL